jgi:hypothetical protein
MVTRSTRNLIDSYQSKMRQLEGKETKKEIKNLEYQFQQKDDANPRN